MKKLILVIFICCASIVNAQDNAQNKACADAWHKFYMIAEVSSLVRGPVSFGSDMPQFGSDFVYFGEVSAAVSLGDKDIVAWACSDNNLAKLAAATEKLNVQVDRIQQKENNATQKRIEKMLDEILNAEKPGFHKGSW